MSKCAGYTKKGLRCKNKCKNKYCMYHCKQKGGKNNNKPMKKLCKVIDLEHKRTKYYKNKGKVGGAKKKNEPKYKPKIDLDKYPQVIIEQKRAKHNDFFIRKGNANEFCAMSDVRPGQASYAFQENGNGLVAIIDDEPVGFLLFTPKKRMKMRGGKYMYLELICTSRNSQKRKDKKTGKNIPIGTLLLTKFEQIAIALGYPKLKGESVKEAVKFYEKNGWTVGKDKQHKMSKKLNV